MSEQLRYQHGTNMAYRYGCRCVPCCQARLIYGRNTNLIRRYGISFSDIEQVIERQDHKCPICRKTLGRYGMEAGRGKGGGGDVHIDHDHETNAFRGVLCRSCNQGLGKFKDDPNALERAAQYVRNCGKITAEESE